MISRPRPTYIQWRTVETPFPLLDIHTNMSTLLYFLRKLIDLWSMLFRLWEENSRRKPIHAPREQTPNRKLSAGIQTRAFSLWGEAANHCTNCTFKSNLQLFTSSLGHILFFVKGLQSWINNMYYWAVDQRHVKCESPERCKQFSDGVWSLQLGSRAALSKRHAAAAGRLTCH